jgi:hypothetical protein
MRRLLAQLRRTARDRFLIVAATLSAVVTGATAAILAVSEPLLFRPTRIPQLERLQVAAGLAVDPSLGDPVDWWSNAPSAAVLAQVRPGDAAVRVGETDPVWLRVAEVSWNFLDLVGLPMVAGRRFSSGDEDGLVAAAAVPRWATEKGIGGRVLKLGDQLTIGGRQAVIVGVVADELDFPYATTVWVSRSRQAPQPNHSVETTSGATDLPPPRGAGGLFVIRLRDGAPPGQLEADLSALLDRANAEVSPKSGVQYGEVVETTPLRSYLTAPASASLPSLLAGAVFLLLLSFLGCGILLGARRRDRRREAALRVALGATYRHRVEEAALEGGALTLVTAALASIFCVLSLWVAHSVYFPTSLSFAMHPGMFAKACAASSLISIAPGMLVAFPAALRGGSIVDGSRSGHQHFSIATAVLVCMQIALATALAWAGLAAVRSIAGDAAALWRVEPSRTVAASVAFNGARLKLGIMDELRAALSDAADTDFGSDRHWAVFEHIPIRESERRYVQMSGTSGASMVEVVRAEGAVPGVTGLRLSGGRFFTGGTVKDEVVLSEAALRRLQHAGSGVGDTVEIGGRRVTVVGVVHDESETSAGRAFLPLRPTVGGLVTLQVLVSCSRSCDTLGPSLLGLLGNIEGVRVPRVELLSTRIERDRRPAVARGVLASWFSILALLVSLGSVFGLTLYSVSRRKRELAVRSACGAAPMRLVFLVTRATATCVVVGVGAGVLIVLAGASIFAHYGLPVGRVDPVTVGIAGSAVAVVALWATLWPAVATVWGPLLNELRQP